MQFFALCLRLSSDVRNLPSCALTALTTVRQIVALVMEASREAIALETTQVDSAKSIARASGHVLYGSSPSTIVVNSADKLIRDFCIFARALPGEWIRGKRREEE